MKNSNLFWAILIIIIVGLFIYFQKSKEVDQNSPVATDESIAGCYVATLGQDVYTLKVSSENDGMFEGALWFKNYQKDSSHGTYSGTYENGILFGDYSFNSEGMDSVMEVIFKKEGNTFVRGFGDLNETGDKFADLNNISYDPNQTFVKTEANCVIPL